MSFRAWTPQQALEYRMKEKGQKHVEAFCLMKYRADDGTEERLWNSRDGVTPFIVFSRDGKEMRHVEWQRDQYAPNYRPQIGERIFVDATHELIEPGLRSFIDRYWESEQFPMSERFESKEAAFDALLPGHLQDGQPFVLELTAENILSYIKPAKAPQQGIKALIYDCEIIKCIPGQSNERTNTQGLEFCAGWHDHANMGIACIAVYDYHENRYLVFLKDNFAEFQQLVREREIIIGFNSKSFDDNLCAAHGIEVKTTYDLLCDVWRAAGMPDHYTQGVTRPGYRLDNLARINLGYGKVSHGAVAPALWQRGQHTQVINYCLHDVQLVKELLIPELIDPTTNSILRLQPPFPVRASR